MNVAMSSFNNSIAKKVSWLVVGQSWVRLSQIAIVVALARLLTSAEWNVVALVFTIHIAVVTIGSFNLEHSVLYFLPTLQKSDAEALFAQSVRGLFMLGSGLGLLVAVSTSALGVFSQPWIPILLGVAIACELPTVIAGPTLVSWGREPEAGSWDVFVGLVLLVCTVLPAILAFGSLGVVTGIAVSSLIRVTVFGRIFWASLMQQDRHVESWLFRRQLMFCLPLGMALATGVLTRTIDKWLVAWKIPESLGVYVIAAQEVPILSVLPYASGAVVAGELVRRSARNDFQGSFQLWSSQVRTMCAPVVALTFAVMATAGETFAVLFDTSDPKVIMCFQIFTLIGLHRVTEYGAVLRAVGRTRDVVLASALLCVLNSIFAFAGLVLGGIVGLTVGSVVAFAIAWLWVLHRLGSIYSMPLHLTFPWRHWLTLVAIFGATTWFSNVVTQNMEGMLMPLGLKLFIFALVYWATHQFVLSPTQPDLKQSEYQHVV